MTPFSDEGLLGKDLKENEEGMKARYADLQDVFLMVFGCLAALINGFSLPLTSFWFGSITTAFISRQKCADDPGNEINETNSRLFISVNNLNMSSVINVTYPRIAFIPEGSFLEVTDTMGMYYIYVGLFVSVLTFIQNLCWEMACGNQVFKLRQIFFAQTMRQDISWYDERENDDLASKITDDLERIRDGLGCKVPILLNSISLLFSGIAVGFFTSWKLTLVIMIGGPILLISNAISAKIGAGAFKREQLRYGLAGGIASEVLTSIKTVCAFGGQNREIDRFSKAVTEGKRLAMKKYYYLSIGCGTSLGLLYFLYGLGIWYGSELLLNHEIIPGQIFTVFMSVVNGALGIGSSLPFVMDMSAAFAAVSSIFEIIDTVPRIDPYSKEGQILHSVKGDIEFKNVYFAYPTRQNVMVLNGLDLKIPAGKVVAIVGASGTGKSTLGNLLLRFYDPVFGKVLIDNNDISNLNIHNLRNIIGVVSQEPVLFDMTIEENIRHGKPSSTRAEVEEAAKVAFAHSFIEALPKGYETFVGEHGTQLSGGQKQRIAIARAIVRKPQILLLDEATSALDSTSELLVQEALENAAMGRTTLIIAHRLSTVKNADIIYSLEDGKIAEGGSHEELMGRKGIYYNLVLAQSKKTIHLEEEKVDTVNCNEIIEPLEKKLPLKRFSILRLSRRISSLLKLGMKQNEDGVCYFEMLKVADSPIRILVAVIACIITGFHIPTFAALYGGLLGIFSLPENELKDAVNLWCLLFSLLALFSSLFLGVAVMTSSAVTENMIKELRIKTFRNLLSQQISFFDDKTQTPIKLTNTLAKEPPLVKNIAGMRSGTIIITTITTVLSLGIAFYCGWRLALIVLCFAPFIVYGNWMHMKFKSLSYVKQCETISKVAKIASECLINIKTVQFLCLQEYMLTVYIKELQISHREELKQSLILSLAYALVNAAVFCMYGMTFKYGSKFVDRGYMTGDDIFRTVFALVFASSHLGMTTLFFHEFGKARVAILRVFQLKDSPSKLDNFSNEGERPEIHGDVEFKNVHFAYPTRRNIPILQGLSLKMPQGKTVALVGGSGCGKSTIISLLERFYDPCKGEILIDGVNVEKINVRHLRSQIGLVTQEPSLFDCSIRENICYGTIDIRKVSDQEMIEAAKAANIHDFIVSLPEGYETKVGDRGSRLSGGQKQRVAIARALLRNPKILLLDEATSALDSESEKVVQEALDKAREGRTSIVVAHRLSTVKNADLIAVIADGRVVEIGTHSQLIQLQGHYFDLVKNQ